MANEKIRTAARESGVALWEIGDVLKVSEATITRKLRRELSQSEQEEFLEIICTLKEKHQEGGADNGSGTD